jgi:hypothetical protein
VIVPHRFDARISASERRAVFCSRRGSIRAFPESAVDWRAALVDSRALTLAQAF